MPETKFVKIVSDGQEYCLLWDWSKHLTPIDLKTSYTYASGPFKSVMDADTEADKAISPGWTPIRYRR
jgi:hypothetical protein